MDLWIRSQDKSLLIKAETITLSPSGLSVMVKNYSCGTYESVTRALEVMDEIEKMLITNINDSGGYHEIDIRLKTEILCNMRKVYIMPKK